MEELVTTAVRVVVLLARLPQAQAVDPLQRLVYLIRQAGNPPTQEGATSHRQKLEALEAELGRVDGSAVAK